MKTTTTYSKITYIVEFDEAMTCLETVTISRGGITQYLTVPAEVRARKYRITLEPLDEPRDDSL